MKELAVKYSNRVYLTFLIFLSLISCTPESSITESSIVLTNTPLPKVTTPANNNPTSALIVLTTTPSSTAMLSLLPEGKLLFENSATKDGLNTFGFVMLDLETKESVLVVEGDQEVNGQSVSLYHPNITWSPDRHWFAFVGTDVRADVERYAYQDIFIARIDGAKLYRLTYSPQSNKNELSWSPDGASILTVMGENGSFDLYLISVKGGDIFQRLTASGNVVSGTWAPDGQRIAFVENAKLFVMNINDKTPVFMGNLPDYTVEEISWSPRGDKLALSILGNNIGCSDIFVFDLNTMEIRDLTNDDYAERSPSWLPDGQHMIFSRATYTCGEPVGQGVWDIYMSDTSGNKQVIVPNVGYQTSVSWVPMPNLEIGKQYTITEWGANLNLRTEPSLGGKILEIFPAGEVITVLEGFVDADDYYWWKIRAQDGTEGWAVEAANWYKPLNE
jgi:Tol biopolymer transport system component